MLYAAVLFPIYFGYEEGNEILFWKVIWLRIIYIALYPIRQNLHNHRCDNLICYIIL
jgi:hypothetical protein